MTSLLAPFTVKSEKVKVLNNMQQAAQYYFVAMLPQARFYNEPVLFILHDHLTSQTAYIFFA